MQRDETERRLGSLERWRHDLSTELREWEAWVMTTKPFLEMLQTDLLYRRKRREETAAEWSTLSKVLLTLTAVIVCLASVGSFIIAVIHAIQGGG